MVKRLLSDEQIAYFEEIADGRFADEITAMMNAKFKVQFTEKQIKNAKSRHKIKSNIKGMPDSVSKRRKLTTPEQENFILENYKGRYSQELADLVNFEFGTNFTADQMKRYRARNKLDSGLTCQFNKGHSTFNKGLSQSDYMSAESIEKTKATRFKKGEVPPNWKPIGSERITRDGYIEVKVQDKAGGNNYRLKAAVIMEEVLQRSINSNEVVIYLDRNPSNLNPENLRVIKRNELLRMNQNQLWSENSKTNEVAVTVAKVLAKIGEKRK